MTATVGLSPVERPLSSFHPDRLGDSCGYRDGCRCFECGRAWKAYLRDLETRSYDPAEAVDHVRWLLDCGISQLTIAEHSGVNRVTIGLIASGKTSQVRFHVAQRLFKVTPQRVGTPIGASRRLQGLVLAGWPISELIRRSRLSSEVIYRVLGNCSVSASTISVISELWSSLWRDDPGLSGVSESGVAQATHYAKLKGWVPVLAWADDEIELPEASPSGVRAAGWSVSWAELIDEIEELCELGVSFTHAAERLGYEKPRSLEKRLARGGAQRLLEELRRNELRHELRDAT